MAVATGNTNSLRTIDSAMFVISYDDEPSSGFSQNATTFLHSDGTNRYVRTSVDLTKCGFNYIICIFGTYNLKKQTL